MPALTGALVEPEPAVPAEVPRKYSRVASGELIAPPGPVTLAEAAFAEPSKMEPLQVIETVAVALLALTVRLTSVAAS